MTSRHSPQKLKAVPVQLLGTNSGVFLKRGCTELMINGDRAYEILELVLTSASNEGLTLQEICKLFPIGERQVVQELIKELMDQQILLPASAVEFTPNGREDKLDIFYWHFGQNASLLRQRLNSHRLAILGVNSISRQLAISLDACGMENFQIVDYPLLRNLRFFDNGGSINTHQWLPDLKTPLDYQKWWHDVDSKSFDCLIATSDFGNSHVFQQWNKFCVERNVHFFPVVLHNLIGFLGPFVVPGETACFECLLTRQNSHMEDTVSQRASEEIAFEAQSVIGFHPSMASILGDLAAYELTKIYSAVLPACKIGALIEINLLASRLEARKILKIPRCAVCSPLITRSSASAKKSLFVTRNRTSK